MKKTIRFAVLAFVPLLGFGCGKNNDQVNNPTRAIDYSTRYKNFVNKNWISENCVAGALAATHYKLEYRFYNDKFDEVVHYFSDDKCTQEAMNVTYTGNTEIRDTGDAANSKTLDLTFTNAKLRALNDTSKNLLTMFKTCGLSSIEVGKDYDVTAATATKAGTNGICLLNNSNNVKVSNRYVVDNGKLYLGSGYKESAGEKDPAARPADVKRDQPFDEIPR